MKLARTALLVALALLSARQLWSAPAPEVWLSPLLEKLPTNMMGPFVRLKDGGILTVAPQGEAVIISRDEGATWSGPIPLFPKGDGQVSNERALLRTKDGAIVLAFMNLKTRGKSYWDDQKLDFTPEIRLDVWTIRSTDDGKTWTDAQSIQQGYSGAMRGLTQAANGNLVLATQDVVRNPARHVTTAYYSSDDGKSWQRAKYVDADGKSHDLIDIGGHGHHDGAIEPTVELLKDGGLWMLIRTGHDWFWEVRSRDGGVTWTNFRKTAIGASSAPGMLKRLADGRLMLVWNQLYPEGKDTYDRKGMPWHVKPSSYHREELSIALSDDDGVTWTKPLIIARQRGKWLAYPYVFEQRPGVIWLTTMQGEVRVKLLEKDLLTGTASK